VLLRLPPLVCQTLDALQRCFQAIAERDATNRPTLRPRLSPPASLPATSGIAGRSTRCHRRREPVRRPDSHYAAAGLAQVTQRPVLRSTYSRRVPRHLTSAGRTQWAVASLAGRRGRPATRAAQRELRRQHCHAVGCGGDGRSQGADLRGDGDGRPTD
jgi:hypothetical protein